MKAAIVDGAGKLLYFGNADNSKFQILLAGNTRVDVPPNGADIWDGNTWSTGPKPIVDAPLDAEELFDMLKAKGHLTDVDRLRPKPKK